MDVNSFRAALQIIQEPADGWVTLHLTNGEVRSGKLDPVIDGGLVSFVGREFPSSSSLFVVELQQVIAVSLVPGPTKKLAKSRGPA
jgi:hypothetical protein